MVCDPEESINAVTNPIKIKFLLLSSESVEGHYKYSYGISSASYH